MNSGPSADLCEVLCAERKNLPTLSGPRLSCRIDNPTPGGVIANEFRIARHFSCDLVRRSAVWLVRHKGIPSCLTARMAQAYVRETTVLETEKSDKSG